MRRCPCGCRACANAAPEYIDAATRCLFDPHPLARGPLDFLACGPAGTRRHRHRHMAARSLDPRPVGQQPTPGHDAGHRVPPAGCVGRAAAGGADRAWLCRLSTTDAAVGDDAGPQRLRRHQLRFPRPRTQQRADARRAGRPGRQPAHAAGVHGADGRLRAQSERRRRALRRGRAFDGLGHRGAPCAGPPRGAGHRGRVAVRPQHRRRHARRQPAQPAGHRRCARAIDDGQGGAARGRPRRRPDCGDEHHLRTLRRRHGAPRHAVTRRRAHRRALQRPYAARNAGLAECRLRAAAVAAGTNLHRRARALAGAAAGRRGPAGLAAVATVAARGP